MAEPHAGVKPPWSSDGLPERQRVFPSGGISGTSMSASVYWKTVGKVEKARNVAEEAERTVRLRERGVVAQPSEGRKEVDVER
ncbi:hypothetical protein NDU88_005000 [Pleurodeles waltl]|uniref:Uncharacterized protein n=1 Tax=Pleurodeles waltl TaxID=8319 RepID=A0AAV7UKU3_PLEWA|nr:hypothetical protein NDU88_005000 [Pleurodeles waltl]